MWHTSVLFTGTTKSAFSTPHISITAGPISTKFTYFMLSINMCLHTKLEENWFSSFRDTYMLLKIAQFSSHFSSSHRFNTIPLSQKKQPSPLSISFKFGTLIRHIVAYLRLQFGDV